MHTQLLRYVLIVALIAAIGFAFWKRWDSGVRAVAIRVTPAPAGVPKPLSEVGANHPALEYAQAVQRRDCEKVMSQTAWIQARLERVQLESGTTGALNEARKTFCDDLTRSAIEENQLRSEGVEDKYVFAPGAAFEFVREDKGLAELSSPVASRAWIRVTYPLMSRALRDEDGRPIESLIVGVNVSDNGQVVKAGVIGNLEIDTGSIDLKWGAAQEHS